MKLQTKCDLEKKTKRIFEFRKQVRSCVSNFNTYSVITILKMYCEQIMWEKSYIVSMETEIKYSF